MQQRGAQQVLRGVQGQGVAQLGAADDAGLFADEVARIGAEPVAVALMDGGVKFVRRRKVVRVLVAHKVQRHLRQRALKVPQAGRQALLCQWGAAGLPANQSGMKKHREGTEPSRCFAMIYIAASALEISARACFHACFCA